MSDMRRLDAALQQMPALRVLQEEPLARHTSFKIGGPAERMAFPTDETQLAFLLEQCTALGIRPVLLGAGTNVLAPDAGLRGLVICTKDCLDSVRLTEPDTIEAYAGLSMARLAQFARDHGLTGLEFAHGIPGTVGGGLFMNAGAYGGEICQVAVQTTVLMMDGTQRVLRGDAQGFGYRKSAFSQMDCIILKAEFQLKSGDPQEILATMQALAERRRASQPLELPSAGSTFKRPKGAYAAALIEQAGLKGTAVGGAAVSVKHAGFIVNNGGATCADVRALISLVQDKVEAASGIRLEPEVRIL